GARAGRPGGAGRPAHPDVTPSAGGDVPIEGRALHAVERGGLVRLVEDADRREDQAGADGGGGREHVVEVDLLERHLAARLATLDLGILQLQLGAEGDALAE